MSLAPGTRLGPYEILAPLGAGGMGEVHRARDTRLGRDVAIKVLPPHLADTADARARFEREAKAISGLNHPHICTLHDIGHEGGTDYLVMELVEGETLAARLARGALPAADLLRVGVQIAEALDAAHRRGIVHRDLKPGNVMLTKSGAKLLDFGLARASGAASAPGALSAAPTRTTPLTAEGSLVGTFQYMSPELLEGKETDARGDLWALGCVLYEMATGRRAFEGSTQASLISAIMRDQPRPISELTPLGPPALDRLVQQCLAKDPDDRWQSAGDVKRELQWIAGSVPGAGAAGPAAPAARRRGRAAWVPWGACGVLLAALAFAVVAGNRPPSGAPPRLIRFVVPQTAGATLPVPADVTLAPDGSALVYVQGDSVGAPRLALRPLRTTDVRALPGTEGASLPFWSPDGQWIGFFADGKLCKVALDGSAPSVLCDAPDGRGGAWAPDGTILFAPNNSGPIFRVGSGGGDPVPVTRIEAARHEFGHRYPSLLPDGRHFLYISIRPSDRHTVCVGSLDGGSPKELFASYSVARYARGCLLTNERGRVMARRFDPRGLVLRGDPQLVAEGAEQDNIGYDNLAPDDGGTLVFQRHAAQPVRLAWCGRSGAPLPSSGQSVTADGFSVLTPDARRLVFVTRDPRDIWTLDLDAAVPTRLTFENSNVNGMAISSDGRRVAFGRQLGFGAYELRVKPLDGAGPEVPLFRGPGLFTLPNAWSPDGRWIVTAVSDSTGGFDFWLVPAGGPEPARLFEHTPGDEAAASFSPDGRWMAYATAERGKVAVYVVSFPTPDTKYQLSLAMPVVPVVAWSTTGRELFLGDTHNHLIAVEIQTTPTFRQGAAQILFAFPPNSTPVGMAPDGARFLLARADPAASRAALEVVLDWPQLLETRR